jgi:hypothetical protein
MEHANLLAGPAPAASARIAELRALALTGLGRMYDAGASRFVFRLRKSPEGIVREGLSDRYTAITAIGLARETPEAVRQILGGDSLAAVLERLIARADAIGNLGDLALIAWAGHAAGCATDRVWSRILQLDPVNGSHPTVEVAWTLSAAALDTANGPAALAGHLAERLQRVYAPDAGLFPHHVGEHAGGQRGHVSCFADLVYPTLALAQFGSARRDAAAIRCAAQCADRMCRNQGPAGQWWWHFDYRTGRVLEGYPVYAVHQTSMAPMALLAAAAAAGTNYDDAIGKGLDWLSSSPELDGRTLIDRGEGLIWRKVARREPAKLSRYVQAAVSRVSPNLRAPAFFPATAIDFEDRPYHLGWILFAWPPAGASVAGRNP